MTNTDTISKPITLRIIFILNALMAILPFVFYIVFTTEEITLKGLDPMLMIYTGIAYIVSFILLVRSILTKNIKTLRILIGINLLIALPAKAYIGIVVALISITLSFNNRVKAYFAQ